MKQTYALAIHGGCGNVVRGRFNEEQEQAYLKTLHESLRNGQQILEEGESALQAIESAIRILEDSPLFNAGRGSVFTHLGTHEMDASLMDGNRRRAGAVTGVKRLRNPISAARSIMEHSSHVMLAGAGAEAFAEQQGLEFVTPDWLFDQTRWDQYQKALGENRQFMDHASDDQKYGTVGAVALDRHGNLAAGSSTGGITNKKHGRIGDSPIIGAGTYADNATCAISCTGEGEYFIRDVTAHRVSALMEYAGNNLSEAAANAMKSLEQIGGHGGFIGVDQSGNIVMPFNTQGMFRGSVSEDGKLFVKMYEEV